MNETHLAWKLICDPLSYKQLNSVPEVTPLQVQILVNRGIAAITDSDDRDAVTAKILATATVMRKWLAADATCLADPHDLPDMDLAVALIREAREEQKRIAVVGDCDVDGLTATAIIVETLRHLGVNEVEAFVMPRSEDGRGLTYHTVDQVIDWKAQLCITVDNGSSSRDEIALLRSKGVRTIITDHHHTETPPEADAFVNPLRPDATYPNPEISGAGVALQLARALCDDTDLKDGFIIGLLDLAGMGTMADVVSLNLENHTLIVLGLHQINQHPRPGLRALLALANKSLPINARDISFGIGPRLNAAGRMGDPRVALELLLTHDLAEAQRLGQKLDEVNRQRQDAMEDMLTEAQTQAETQFRGNDYDGIIFVQGQSIDEDESNTESQDESKVTGTDTNQGESEVAGTDASQGESKDKPANWSLGIVGLVAGRLADTYHTLAVAVAVKADGNCRGSLRGQKGFHIAETLAAYEPPLKEFGGHALAGGFATTEADLPFLRKYLADAYANRAARAAFSAQDYRVDAELPFENITWSRVAMVHELEPYGTNFVAPLFVSRRVTLRECLPVNSHLRIIAVNENGVPRTFFWAKGGDQIDRLRDLKATNTSVDILWRMPKLSDPRRLPEPYVEQIIPHISVS